MAEGWKGLLRRIDAYRYEIPREYKAGMRVPGLIFADEHLLPSILEDQALEQVANVAFLPGIVERSLAMPDIHWGYGFPVGGVAATRVEDGVISPGGIGFDINCGVRLLRTNLTEADVKADIQALANALYYNVPSGVGSEGRVRLDAAEIGRVLANGARWAVERGYGHPRDLEFIEEEGCIKQVNPDKVSEKARKRGIPQLGTLGSGNHFLEVQTVEDIYRPSEAKVFGVESVGQVLVMIHTGSRGLGHQVCDDYLRIMGQAVRKYGIDVPDRQLACAPLGSEEGGSYFVAMSAAANYAWANRQCIAHWVRESFAQVLRKSIRELGLDTVYDVAHNIAKLEDYDVEGRQVRLCVHRKGATRAFGPGSKDIPAEYRSVGQPVLIPGDMGRYSYLAVGSRTAMQESFGSTCHGAGRLQSRTEAKKSLRGVDIARRLAEKGIVVRVADRSALAEEASEAYKDVAEVVHIVDGAGLSYKVARMRPLAVVKG